MAWEKLASVDLSGGAASTLNSGTFTAKKHLWVQGFIEDSGTPTSRKFIVGNTTVDTGNNYARRYSADGGGDSTSTSSSRLFSLSDAEVVQPLFFNAYIINESSEEKLTICEIVENGGATGAGTAPSRVEAVGKWANTSSQIDVVEINADANMGTNTRLTVYGTD